MTLDSNATLYTLSTISQTIATILSISLGIFIFTLERYSKDMPLERNTIKRRKSFVLVLFATTIISSLVAFYLLYPSQEMDAIIFLIVLMILATAIISYNIIVNKHINSIGFAIMMLSSLFFVASLSIGVYIIFLIFSRMVSVPLEDETVWYIIRLSREYLVSLLISTMYLTSFICYHKICWCLE